MSKAFRTNIDLHGNQLLNALAHPTSAAPAALGAGQLYYNTTSSALNVYNGATFDALIKTSVTSLASLTTIGTGTGLVYSTSGALTVYTTSGTGTVVALTAGPTFTGSPVLSTATATSINGLTITTTTGTLTLANGSTLALAGGTFSTTLNVTAATSVTLPTSGTLVNSAVASLTSLGTVSTSLTGFVSAASGVLSASSTVAGTSVSGNITGNAANVTGVVGLTNGGTGANLTITPGGIVYGGATVMAITAAGTTGYLLVSNGASAPTWIQSTSTNVNSTVVQRDSTGNIAVTQVTVSADPTQALQVATKQYVDNLKAGFNLHEAVEAASTTDLTTLGTWGTVTYTAGSAGADGGTGIGATLTPANNGVLVIDNYTPDTGDRVLIKNQTTTTQNGVYTLTTVGTVGSKWTLTRSTDYDNNVLGMVAPGDMFFVAANTAEFTITPTNQNTLWAMNNASGTATGQTIKIGTDNITFVQFSGAGSSVTAGAGIGVAGSTVSIALGTTFDAATGADTTGLSLLSNTLKVRLNSAGGLTATTAGIALATPGTGLAITANAISFATGTTAQTATGASGGAFSYATQKQTATITTDGTTTSWAINHNFASRDVIVRVYQTSAGPDTQYNDVEMDILRTSTSVVTVSSGLVIPTGNTYNVVIVG